MILELEKYEKVIKRVFERNAGKSSTEFYAALTGALEIAADLMGDDIVSVATPLRAVHPPARILEIPKKTVHTESIEDQFKGAILISATAPPVAGAGEDNEPEDDIDYWESAPGKGDGCKKLESRLNAILPVSIEVQLPGFDEPLKLVRGVSGPGLKFVYVTYGIPGGDMGPRFTLMTSWKPEEVIARDIIADIVTQAGVMYSKEKRKLMPKAAPSPGMPSSQDLSRMMEQDRKNQRPNDGLAPEEAALAKVDAASWGTNRGPNWQ